MKEISNSISGLFEHVKDAILAVVQSQTDRGRAVIPTGGGKTAVEAHSLRLRGLSRDFKVHLILAPRIALTNQLIKEYRGYIGHGYLAMAFHSGKTEPDFAQVKWEELNTTSVDVVKEQIARSQSMGKNLVIFSTYHSAWKLVDLDFGMVIADESQYCVGKDYFETITNLKAEFKLFCTATEKHVDTTDLGRGLNNETVFGPIIYQISAQELIDRGIIVPPRLHIMTAEKSAKTSSSVIDETIRIAEHQHALTINSGMPYSKILFAMNGTDDIRKVIASINKIKQALPTHKIFTIMSNEKYGAMIDGSKMIQITHNGQIWENKISRSVFFQQLRETDNALIFHYDIISEGIDIDGITGVVINRNMTLSKLLQTIGRAVRKYKAAPELKPQAWVTVTAIDGDIENQKWIESVLTHIRAGGFAIENIKFTSMDGPGIDEDEGLEDQYGSAIKGTIQTTIENIIHEIEDGLEWKKLTEMTFAERMDLMAKNLRNQPVDH
jgi:superfamily II DNA or RNA helicase